MESDENFFSFMTLAKELVTDNRPLRLRLDLPGGTNDDMLLPQRVYGSESICGGIEYRVLCVAANAQLPLKQLIAVPAVLEFVTDRGDLRAVCGIVTEASAGDHGGVNDGARLLQMQAPWSKAGCFPILSQASIRRSMPSPEELPWPI